MDIVSHIGPYLFFNRGSQGAAFAGFASPYVCGEDVGLTPASKS